MQMPFSLNTLPAKRYLTISNTPFAVVLIITAAILYNVVPALYKWMTTLFSASTPLDRQVIISFVLLLIITIVVTMIWDWRSGTYPATLMMTISLIPTVAGLATVITYILQKDSNHAILIGPGIALLTWLAFPLFYRSFAAVSLADPSNYAQLKSRLDHLQAIHDEICPCNSSDKCTDEVVARNTAKKHLDFVATQLVQNKTDNTSSLPWILGTGYTNLWSRIHRAEEALIVVAPRSDVITGAIYDELRLQDSTIPNAEKLVAKLRQAVMVLDPVAAKQYLINCPDDLKNRDKTTPAGNQPPDPNVVAGVPTQGNPRAAGRLRGASQATEDEIAARGMLREVRNAINVFRDSRWEGLLHARNRLIRTGTLTSILTFMLLLITISNKASPTTITSVAVFYLVGALAGLFARLRADEQAQGAVDDYGLTTARLCNTPLFSGIAAVGGILLIGLVPAVMPHTTESVQNQSPVASLEAIFDIYRNGFGLILAALFGLTPGLLIDRLQAQAESYKVDLQSTESTAKSETVQQTTKQG